MPKIDNEDFVPKAKNTPRKAVFRWVRAFAAVAAVFVVIIFGSVTAKAFGFDIWEAVVQWTQETFHFGSWGNSNTNNDLPYATLKEALEKGNIPAWFAPTWFPEGFYLADIAIDQSPIKKVCRAIYINGERTIRITIQEHFNMGPTFVEQSDGLVEEYVVSGITYYIFANNDQVRAAWLNDSYECDISGDVTIEELKKMIDSIQKG